MHANPEPDKAALEISLAAKISILLITPLSALAMSGLPPILPLISAHFADYPGADVLVRLLVTSVGGTIIVGAPLAGLLADRFGYRTVMIAALLLFAVSGTIGYVLDDLVALVGSRIIFGLAVAAVGIVGPTMFTAYVKERDRWLGYLTSAGAAGAFIIIPVVGVVGAIDWRSVFLLHLAALPLAILAFLTIPKLESPAAPATPASGEGTALPDASRSAGFGKSALRLALLGLVCGIVGTSTIIYLPYHMAAVGIGAPHQIATAMMPAVIGSIVTSFLFGIIRKRLSVFGAFALAFALCCGGHLLLGFGTSLQIIMLGGALNGLGMGILVPNLFAGVGEIARPEWRARLMGIARAGYFGGPLLSQIPLEPLAVAYGSGATLIALALFAGTLATLMIVWRSLLPRVRPA